MNKEQLKQLQKAYDAMMLCDAEPGTDEYSQKWQAYRAAGGTGSMLDEGLDHESWKDRTKKVCPSNPDHGEMSKRPVERQSPDHQWCGDWYDCSDPQCMASMLIHSEAGKAQLEGQYQRIASEFRKLKGKRQKERFLKHRDPHIVYRLREEAS